MKRCRARSWGVCAHVCCWVSLCVDRHHAPRCGHNWGWNASPDFPGVPADTQFVLTCASLDCASPDIPGVPPDTLHRFCKKEHDWGWKKFMELSKVLDGFTMADTLIIKAQVQVIM